MNNRRSTAAIAALLTLSLAGCSTSTVITDLQVALDAVTVALPVIGGLTGVPADVSQAVTKYVTATNQALGEASTILDSAGTDASKATAIAAEFAGIAVPVLPAQYASIAQLVATIAADVAAFLGSVPGLGTAKARAMAASVPHQTKWSLDERLRLSHAHSTAADNASRLAKIARK